MPVGPMHTLVVVAVIAVAGCGSGAPPNATEKQTAPATEHRPVPAVEKPYGAFSVSQRTDDLTGHVSHYATTSTNAVEQPGLDLTLFLSCEGKALNPWYHFDRKLVAGRYGLF